MYAKIASSTCQVWHGLVKVGFHLCLELGDNRYNDVKYQVIDWDSTVAKQGYPGLVNALGQPLDLEYYKAWEDSLPRIWLSKRVFHTHFLRFEPNVSQDDVVDAITYHIPNFYKAWTEELDKLRGGMRMGWDIATRHIPRRYDREMSSQEYAIRKDECYAKVRSILAVADSLIIRPNVDIGELFPSTEIDIGYGAVDGNTYVDADANTCVSEANSANETGTLDYGEAYFYSQSGTNQFYFGTFSASGNDLTCHDSDDGGDVTGTGKQTFSGLSFEVNSGEYLGIYDKGGQCLVDATSTDPVGLWFVAAEVIDPTDTDEFVHFDIYDLCVYATGQTAPQEVEVTVSDAITLGSVINTGFGHTLAETLTLTESLVKTIDKIVSDAITLTESIFKGFGHTLAETLTLTESIFKGFGHTLAETLTLTESLVKTIDKTIADALSLTDTITKGFGHMLSEAITLTESLIAGKLVSRVVSDTITLVDCLIRWRLLTAIRNLRPGRCPQPSIRELPKIDDGLTGP